MFGIIIFFIILALVMWSLRYFGLKYYEKIENQNSINTSEPIKIKSTDEEEDNLLPVIIAAASAILYSKVKVKKVSFVDPHKGSDWSHTGRIQSLTSHYMSPPKTYKY